MKLLRGLILLVTVLYGGYFLTFDSQQKDISSKNGEIKDLNYQEKTKGSDSEKSDSWKIAADKKIEYGYGNPNCVDGVYRMNDVATGGWGISFNCPDGVTSGEGTITSSKDAEHDMTIFTINMVIFSIRH